MPDTVADLSQRFSRLISEQRLEVPPMPTTGAEVLQLSQQETTDAAKLSAVIHRDPAIASNVLRVANSAAHAGQTPCASLQQAVSRLGMQRIAEIAVAVSVRGGLFSGGSCAGVLAALWRHSVVTAFFAKEIARARRRNVETAFLCGLLHDVGKGVLCAELARHHGASESVPTAELAAALQANHLAAGEVLAGIWKLPAVIAETIRHHHAPSEAPQHSELAMTVALADAIAHHVDPDELHAHEAADDLQIREHPALLGLNLYGDQLDELLALKDEALAVAEGLR
jgi:putative nucleotidyltransferase with HDIG domain